MTDSPSAPASAAQTPTEPAPGSESNTDLACRIRTILDGPWHDIRDQVRGQINREDLIPDPSRTLTEARDHIGAAMRELAQSGFAEAGFRVEHGGTGNVGAAITAIETMGYADLSLMVKAGVQWGLFGGAIENLGTQRHHDAYVRGLIDLDVLGCFAMTETGHGSNVMALETVARYDRETGEFVINSETPSARKDYIGGAGRDARFAAVFAQLETAGPDQEPTIHGVHCFVVRIRDDEGNDLPGITTSDCGYKGGLAGVDNGRIMFDHVRIPRENLLNRYADVAEDGTYSSPIESETKRFFTMLGTLIRGRVTVAATSGAAARKALVIATRYALVRKQFDNPNTEEETTLLDYRHHQRRLLPLIAKSYAIAFAQDEVTQELHEVQTADHSTLNDEESEAMDERQRELEVAAAGLKAYTSWHASATINEARECCGGAGYLAANQLSVMRGDIDVFTTFEGDNTVMTQLVAKELLSSYASDVRGMNVVGWAGFVADMARDVFLEKSAARQVIQTLMDGSDEDPSESDLTLRGTQIRLFRNREDHLLRTAAARMRKALEDDADAFAVFNDAQDHILKVGQAHTERVVLESFIDAVSAIDDEEVAELLGTVCDLFVYRALEEDLSWFLMHRQVSVERAKAIRRGVNDLCEKLRPHAATLVEAFGVPEELLRTEMMEP